MSIVEVIKSAIRPTAVALVLVGCVGAASAQQPSAAAIQTAKEIVRQWKEAEL